MIIRNRLAELLFWQDLGYDLKFESLLEHERDDYLERADQIIELFVDAIKKLEFKV